MAINIIDAVVILIVLSAAVVGLKRGVFNEIVMTIGLLLVYVLAFKLKNPLANWMSLNLPFIKFGGVLKGATALNIVMYQALSFIIVFALLMLIFNIILRVTGIIEKVLKFTIILGIPSKILGFIVGAIEGYILAFIFVFIMSQPFFNIPEIQGSKYQERILQSSPVLSNVVGKSYQAINDIYILEKEFINNKNVDEFNNGTLEILLSYEIIDQDYINDLKAEGKI